MSSTATSTSLDAASKHVDFQSVQLLMAQDMQHVNEEIIAQLTSDVVLINQIGHYIISSGGKRLRPMLVALAANALGYTGRHHIRLAAVIEFIHTATLLHDDVVDESDLRRGMDTANAIWGNAASVLVGDFLYSRAFEMMVSVDQMRVMDILSHTTNAIAEGEVLQLLNINNPDTSEAQYLEVIRRKTAKLFEAGCQLGAVLCEADAETETALSFYGLHLGTAFQIMDDLLDYTANPETLGKNLGDDLAEGKPTLPLIRAMQTGEPEQVAFIQQTIQSGNRNAHPKVLEMVQKIGAVDYTAQRAREEADLAIEALAMIPDSPFKTAMQQLAEFSIQRSY